MRFLSGAGKMVENSDSGAAIRLGETSRREEPSAGRSWGLFLVVFMRLLAVLWGVQGLQQWADILLPREPLFYKVTAFWGAAVIFFAVLDLVAAVGLWLATPWGGVIWLFGAIAQIFVALTIPSFFSMFWIGVNLALVFVYFILTWQAGRTRPPFGRPKSR